jgi:peptidoglycan/LPS O-acetylase OafA/YrhL
VEEVFYIGFPLAAMLFRQERLLLIPLVCLLVVGPINRALCIGEEPWEQYAYLSCVDGIAFGCLAALICARVRISQRTLRASLVAGSALVGLVLLLCNEDSYEGLARYGLNVSLLELGVALMLVALGSGVGNGALSRGTRWVRAVGRASYEIYLFHMLVVLSLLAVFKALHLPLAVMPLFYLAMLLLSILVGWWVSRFYSEPLNQRLRARSAESSPAVPMGES